MMNALLKFRGLSPVGTRFVHTRPKKVTVQLLKDNYGKRFKGEVFDVSEGHMRLKLHPDGIAAYVFKNQPTPIPVLSQTEAQRLRRESQAQAKAAAAKAELEAKESAGPSSQEVQDTKVRSLIDALNFPTTAQQANKSESSESQQVQRSEPSTTSKDTKPSSDGGAQQQVASSKKQFAWQNDFVVNITDRK